MERAMRNAVLRPRAANILGRHSRLTHPYYLSPQYIALERLESIYKSCNLVANICVHANPNAKQPMAVIIPHPDHLRHTLEGKDIGVDPKQALPELCRASAVADLVLKECNAIGKKNGFKPMELLQAVVLTPDEWTPQSGLVTAAQKVQRKKVAEAFDKEIKVRPFPLSLSRSTCRACDACLVETVC